MNIRLKNEGFASLVEVIVTAIIFIIATAGILSTVSMLRPHGQESSNKVEAAYIGKGVLDDLRKEVNASNTGFFGSGLSTGAHQGSEIIGGDGTHYQVNYNVTDENAFLKKVEMQITW